MRTKKRARRYLLWVKISKMRENIQQHWKKLFSEEMEKQMFTDMLTSDTSMVHVDDTGNMDRIAPYSPEWWDIKDKISDIQTDPMK